MPALRSNVAVAVVVVVLVVIVALALGPLSRPPGSTASPAWTATPAGTTLAPGTPQPSATAGPTATTGTSASPRPTVSHVWLIVMENHEYGSIIGSPSAPYINSLAAKYALLTNYYATTHPSEPNYIAIVAGSTLGVTGDGTYDLTGESVFRQLASVGKTWRAYEQDIQPGCFTGSTAKAEPDGPGTDGAYARKHDPAISFTYVSGDATQCANIQPLRDFDPAAAAFAFITPNLINDMHDGSVAQGDTFLRDFVPLITGSPAFGTGVLFITFDEGDTDVGGGGRIATIVCSPGISPAGYKFTPQVDHYGMLRTIELAWSLPFLGKAATATTIEIPK